MEVSRLQNTPKLRWCDGNMKTKMKRRLEEVALSAPGRERADTQMFASQLSLE
ncbi:unnamed protein product [Tenebrio molitor]|nr:unnamed protein product [Tenebrio molitor]